MELSKGAPQAVSVSKSFVVKACLLGTALLATAAVAGSHSATGAGAARRLSGEATKVEASGNSPAPLLGDGKAVDWWFAFKLTTAAFPQCSANPTCMFGGSVSHAYGLQYLLSYGSNGQTTDAALHSECLGNGADPVAKTFDQVYSGKVPNYIVWNDQFYGDPALHTKPACAKECGAPWGHSKGVIAWGDDGTGFVMQVTTPDWPGAGSKDHPRSSDGNTLGCCQDDNVKVSQHFFSLHLASADDTLTLLQAMQRASVATDPNNPQIFKVTSGPSQLMDAAKQLGHQVKDVLDPFQGKLSVKTSKGQIQLIAKPSGLHVSPWHMVSSLTQTPMRTATWWAHPTIPSSHSGYKPGCWDSRLKSPVPEVQAAISGEWSGKTFSFKGEPTTNGNHAKVAHSISGRNLAVFGDMNMQGSLDSDCAASQNGRGGMFFVLEDDTLHAALQKLLTGDTAPYAGGGGPPSPPTPPSPPSPPSPPAPPSPPSPPAPAGQCPGAGTDHRKCKASGCKYIKQADAKRCNVAKYGCYDVSSLPDSCKNSNQLFA